MIKVSDWLRTVRIPLEEGWGYIWGTNGQVWTAARQAKETREMTRRYGAKWIGRRVCDCSGLIYWAARQHGEKMHHGSNLIYTEDIVRSTRLRLSEGGEPRPGSVLFLLRDEDGRTRAHHIGVYLGDGQAVEARGTRQGVVLSPLSRWHMAAELKCVDYEEECDAMD